jgi:hypothetical protein
MIDNLGRSSDLIPPETQTYLAPTQLFVLRLVANRGLHLTWLGN